MSSTPRVFLVGAGPGDPGLLTLRAVECLQQADLVLYDKLVPPRLLDFARPGAERVCVTDLPGEHPQRWPHIHRTLVEEANKGKVVVRLKGGDPLVFGRGGEEAEELRQAGLPYEIVPGVTAGLAAAACAEIPLTHRRPASHLRRPRRRVATRVVLVRAPTAVRSARARHPAARAVCGVRPPARTTRGRPLCPAGRRDQAAR